MNRQMATRGFLSRPNDPGGLDSTQFRHLHIHQDQIESAEARLIQGCQGFSPIRRDDNRVAALFEQARGDQPAG